MPALGIAVVDMSATSRAEGGGGSEGPYPSREPACDDIVDVIDTVNIAAPADACDRRS
jgi:hypothetical protein